MPVDSKHPLYNEWLPDWVLMADVHLGERRIKEADVTYLPATAGQVADGMSPSQPGRIAYEAYKSRARFPDVTSVAVEALVGIMHAKSPTIELPPVMEPLMESTTLQDEGLEVLLRRINEAQLTTGRLGLLLDIEEGAQVGTLPYIVTYGAQQILNWDDGTREGLVRKDLNMVVLDETGWERSFDFEWELKHRYRVVTRGDPLDQNPDAVGVYQTAVFEESGTSFNPEALQPVTVGGRSLEEIPFTFVNSSDIVPAPASPPLLGLGQLAIAIYRAEADYRHALFMQGQDTLVVTGVADAEEEFRTGAGALIALPTGGTAEFIGVSSTGLSEMRSSLENDRNEASQRGGALLDSVSRQKESGDALRIRVVARTATLNQIARTGAFGLQASLRQMARWIGADESKVVVEPNLDFVDDELPGKTLVEYMSAKSLGAPLSLESVHKLMQDKGLTELTFEEEMDLLEAEAPEPTGSTNPDDLEDDDDGDRDEDEDGDEDA